MATDPFAPVDGGLGHLPPISAALREAGAVARAEAPAGGPVWIVTDDALARHVLGDTETFAKDPALAPPHWPGREPGLEPRAVDFLSLTTQDGPGHRALRSAHAPLFTRRRLLAETGRVAAHARTLLADLAAESERTGRPVELTKRFTVRYPLTVVTDLLGLHDVDLDEVERVATAVGSADPGVSGPAFGALIGLVAAAVSTSADDAAPAVLAARLRADSDDVTAADVTGLITGVLFAGQVTTEAFLGFQLAHHLAGHLDPLPTDAPDLDAVVTELLRRHPPAPLSLWRFTTTPTTLAGHDLPTGAPVLVDIEGINTDPRRVPDPARLDPTRRDQILTFGDGPHACIGAQLARLESRVLLDVLPTDYPDANLAVPFDELRHDPMAVGARRVQRVPAWLTAAARR